MLHFFMMKQQHPLLLLVDGSSYLYRAFHALPPLTNSQGEPTGAIYGVLNMLRKLLQDYPPQYVAVIFDPKGKTHRDTLYAHYKAHRPPAPPELAAQVEPLFEIIRAMGLPLVVVDGEEADDVIGTLAHQAQAKQWKVLISTGDKDMAQLVNPAVTLINTMNNVVLDEAGVSQKFGVRPDQIVDYLTLLGDSSDNIPGVPKVGPKTAAKWLQHYGSLEALLAQAADIPGKVGENLRSAQSQLPLTKELVTIRTQLKLPVQIESLIQQSPQQEVLSQWFQRLEFRNWLQELATTPAAIATDYQTITTQSQLQQLLALLRQHSAFALDTETTALNPIDAQLVGISLAVTPQQAFYIPVGHQTDGVQLPRDTVLQQLAPFLENPQQCIIGQNLKYDMSVLANYDIKISAKICDTMLESYILNSASSRHDKNTLVLKYLGQKVIEFEEVAGKGSKQVTFDQVPIAEAAPYACQDADVALQLHHVLWPKITAEPKLEFVLTQIEIPLVPVLATMERQGVLVDTQQLQRLSTEFGARLETLANEAHRLAGKVFNLNSPKQLQQILYEDLKIPVQHKTPTGQPSTAEEVLHELALTHPLPQLLLEYRSLSKLKSTYTDALMAQINPHTGRVHTSYNQAVTATGRLSSTDPNLQNIPIRTEEGKRIRQAFIAPPGYKLISADYSQIELHIMAHLSHDSGLLKAFAQKQDIHTATAAEIFGIKPQQVTPDQRRSAKTINFGLIYGMSAFGLGRALNVATEVAQAYMDLYFERYPGVRQYMDNTRQLAHHQGYVETLFGRRLYLAEINASNMQRRRAAERAAINAPMQGTAADIIKLAMIQLHRMLRDSKLDIKMLLQVHDELVFEVADQDVAAAIPLIRQGMTELPDVTIPIAVEIGSGANWEEAH